MAPPFLPMAWAVIGAASGAAVTVACLAIFGAKPEPPPEPQGRSDCNLLLPRFFLILAVEENLGRLLAAVEPTLVEDFCQKLVGTLREVREKLKSLKTSQNVLDYFDTELVSHCLQRVPEGPSILEGYLPKAGQTWDALLREKVEDEQGLSEAELYNDPNNDNEVQRDIEMSCLDAIDRVLQMFQDGEVMLSNYVKTESELRSPVGELTYSGVPGGIVQTGIQIQKYTVEKVFYATDRQVTEDGEYTGNISSRREIISGHKDSNGDSSIVGASELLEVGPLQFGVAEVGIPDAYRIGGIEAPSHSYEESSPVKHVVILSLDTKMRGNRREFIASVNRDLQQGDLLIFIHGYNVSHKGALKRAAQLKYDLNRDLKCLGAIISYSWSSKGTLYGYPHDETSVEKTVGHLKNFLVSIMTEVKAPKVHILAHSMGNRALVRALNMLLEEQPVPSPRCRLSQIIFAAADEMRSTFEDMLRKLSNRSISTSSPAPDSDIGHTTTESDGVPIPREELLPHLTVYCATDDWALKLSKWRHGFQHRLGDTRCYLEGDKSVDFPDIVDASGMGVKGKLHHSYYGDVPKVIQDLQVLLKSNIPVSSRPNLHKITHLRRHFYAFKEDQWRPSH